MTETDVNSSTADKAPSESMAVPDLKPGTDSGENSRMNLDLLLDVPVNLTIEIGRASMSIGKLLNLNRGSVIELDRTVSDPHDVFVNGTLIAHGEIVVVSDQYGIRFTDIVSPHERVKKL